MNGNDWFHIFKCSHEILASTQSPDCPFILFICVYEIEAIIWAIIFYNQFDPYINAVINGRVLRNGCTQYLSSLHKRMHQTICPKHDGL